MTKTISKTFLLSEIDTLLAESKDNFAEMALKFVSMAEDDDDRRERIFDLAAITKLDGRDPVLDNIISMYDYKDQGSVLDNAWAIADTVQELERLRRILA